MLNKYILSLSDKNKDSKIHIEEHNNEDKIRFITGGQQRMIISNSTTSGNIGIGLNFNNPTSTLDIQGDLAVSNKIGIGTSTVETSLDVDSSLKVFDVLNNISGYVNTSDGNYMKLQATSRTDTSTKKNILLNPDGGNVGIGTNDPSVPLHIYNSSTTNCQVGYLVSEGNSTGMESTYIKMEKAVNYGGIIGGYLYQTVGSGLTFGTTNAGNINHHQMVLNSNGNLGIGTNNPNARLHVWGTSGTVIGVQNHTYYHYGLGGSSGTSLVNLTGAVGSIVAQIDGHFWLNGGGIYWTSDRRIKKNIEEINDNQALLKIRQIKPYKYNYIDELQRGINDVYGFIAQEVKDILPYAVEIQDNIEIVPNIYKNALYNNNIITFEQPHNLNTNGNIKLFLHDNKEIIVPYTIVDTLKINIDISNLSDEDKPSNDLINDENGNTLTNNIFVYGTEISDFHILNKEHIWTTAVAALQEVDRIQQADAVKIQTLETNVSTLETKNTELETEVSNLKTQLTDVLTRLSALENN